MHVSNSVIRISPHIFLILRLIANLLSSCFANIIMLILTCLSDYEKISSRKVEVVILVNLGQGSYNSRTTSAHYTDSVPGSCGQRSYVIRTRTLSQRDKLTSYVLKYHKTASPSSAGGWCSTEGRRDGPFKSKRYAFLTNRSRIASAMV